MAIHRRGLCGALLATFLAVVAAAQTPSFESAVTGQRITCAEYAGGLVFAGLPKGGLVAWDPDSGEVAREYTRAAGLGGHFVKAIAWSGEQVWVATADGGLTAINDPGGSRESLRVFSSALSSLKVTAVAGQVVGTSERVWYGTDGDGIGEIVSGLSGAFYTTLDGLIDDVVDAIALSGDLLLVATPVGVSRFAENGFTSYPYANPATDAISSLAVGPGGVILAATPQGVEQWNDETRTWDTFFGTANFVDLAVDGDAVWALTNGETLMRIEGGIGVAQALPVAPAGEQRVTATVVAAAGRAWVGGMLRTVGLVPAGSLASRPWLAPAGNAGAPLNVLDTCQIGVAGGFDGVAIDGLGRAWLGDRDGDGLASPLDDGWYNVSRLATALNDSSGLYNYSGNLLAMTRDGPSVWFCEFATGAVRFRPAEAPGGQEEWLLLSPEDSPMLGDCFVNLAVHPDGAVFFCTDNSTHGGIDNGELGVDILFEPDRPRAATSWMHLYPAVLGGNIIWAVGFERRDVVWFGVRNVGLQRWDINGPLAGPDDPLTWSDTRDDEWLDEPLLTAAGSSLNLDSAHAILPAADGSLWVGGSGLVHFRYEPVLGRAILLGEWEERTQTFATGLLGQTVLGLGFDRNGHLWALTSAGLNRLRLTENPLAIDAYTDLATYLTLDPAVYSPGVITALPGGTYRRLDMAADGTRLVLSSDLGGAVVEIPAAGAVDEGSLERAYLFPNPFPGDSGAQRLNLGGLELAGGTADVTILNLEGQVVYQVRGLDDLAGVWDGRNRQGRKVAAGLYLVELTFGGTTVVRTLAVTY
ncbi:MAG TPA: hypothetical protein PLL30_13460 [Candidatus Krumholzibacteria bacterium]|nr:hypothetical protein [Candidatus Krumholzibacteria bacterium]